MSVSVLDYIPSGLHAAIAARTSTTDVSTYIQAAIDDVANDGGGTVYFPAGAYHSTDTIENKPFVSWRGDGPNASAIVWPLSHTTHGVRQASGLNGGSIVGLSVEGMGFANCNTAGTTFNTASSAGGGWYDTGSHQVRWVSCNFGGWKYGVILDQSEEIDFYECNFNNNKNGLWIVNGYEAELNNTSEQTGPAAGGYSNRISVHSGGFSGTTNIAILDDGGEGRLYEGININSGVRAGRFSGVTNLRIGDCYVEGISQAPFLFAATTLSGVSAGGCSAVEFQGNLVSPVTGKSMIEISSIGFLTLQANRCSGSTPVMVSGVQNCAAFFSRGNSTDRSMVDNQAVYITQIDEYVLERSVTATVGAIGANSTAYLNITATGFAPGDFVEAITTSVDLGDDIVITARTTTNACRLRIRNEGAATTLPSCTYRALLRKRF
jgi:hypothetical protein